MNQLEEYKIKLSKDISLLNHVRLNIASENSNESIEIIKEKLLFMLNECNEVYQKINE